MTKATTIVIFGASGDLTRRKLIPALFNLWRKGRLPGDYRIVGFAATPWSDAEFRAALRTGLTQFAGYAFTAEEWAAFESRLSYRSASFTDPADFERLAGWLGGLEAGPSDRLYYLATPPQFFPQIVAGLGSAGLATEVDGWRRVVIEKPFGTDLASARALSQSLHRVLDEKQIYRIDHYLGKETVQNILVFRFANTIFEPVWNRNYIDHVQITVAEDVGVGHRAEYYDRAGALRDMFQNHLLQLLALVAMEPAASSEPEALRNEKAKLLNAVRPIPAAEVARNAVRAQYRGYTDEPGVATGSRTETYAALRLYVDNWRWQGVPFYLRSGKRMAEKCTEIVIRIKCPPHLMFPLSPDYEITSNMFALCIQPDEGIYLRFEAKVPDTEADMKSVDMEFHYRNAFGPAAIPEAYERLLLDALRGDPSLFTRDDRNELTWRLLDPIIAAWQAPDAPPLALYEPGTWGPAEADEFLARDGRAWLRGCAGHHALMMGKDNR
jgi:glucose-6-phosphate 1-dehydrogenase